MNRRRFVRQTSCVAALAFSKGALLAEAAMQNAIDAIEVSLDPRQTLNQIPQDFLGLGYEISSAAQKGLLSANNRTYVQIIRTLGATGVIRIGGNTSDYATFDPIGNLVSAPKQSIINDLAIQDLGTFLDAAGWKLIWGLNLGNGKLADAVSEAIAIDKACHNKLLAFEIGNEPDLFAHEGHRPTPYTYSEYLSEYRTFHQAVRKALPNAQFAGPDVAGATDWVTRFAQDEGTDLALLTHHYYREGQNPGSTIEKLLTVDPKLKPLLEKLRAASMQSQLPYRICEMNSFSGGGRPGVSDTLGSALWILDFLHDLSAEGCSGVNIETGVNQLGFISSYSPIAPDGHGTYIAKPIFYGLLAFSQACGAFRVPAMIQNSSLNLSVHAVRKNDRQILLTIINKETTTPAVAKIRSTTPIARGRYMALTGSSIASTTGITYGGSSLSSDGTWKPTRTERIAINKDTAQIRIPAGSAIVAELELA